MATQSDNTLNEDFTYGDLQTLVRPVYAAAREGRLEDIYRHIYAHWRTVCNAFLEHHEIPYALPETPEQTNAEEATAETVVPTTCSKAQQALIAAMQEHPPAALSEPASDKEEKKMCREYNDALTHFQPLFALQQALEDIVQTPNSITPETLIALGHYDTALQDAVLPRTHPLRTAFAALYPERVSDSNPGDNAQHEFDRALNRLLHATAEAQAQAKLHTQLPGWMQALLEEEKSVAAPTALPTRSGTPDGTVRTARVMPVATQKPLADKAGIR